MVRDEARLLHDHLAAVRRLEMQRGSLRLLLAGIAIAAGWATLVVGAVAWSLRGDLGPFGLVVGGLLLGLGALFGVRRLLMRTRSPLALARAIARTPGPLHRVRADPRERTRDEVLRHELLGATELWQAIELERELDTLGSPELAAAYVERIGRATLDIDPRLALARPRWSSWLAASVGALLAFGLLATSEPGAHAMTLLEAGIDGRPLPPPSPVWTSLELELDYPDHTRRPDRRVANPSGALRVPAGTIVRFDLVASDPEAAQIRVVLVHDASELGSASEPEVHLLSPDDAGHFRGEMTVRGSGTWTAVRVDDDDDDDDDEDPRTTSRSPAMRLELEPDAPPEVELQPLPEAQRETNETSSIELRFSARDDFGVVEAELVYELAEGERHRLPAGEAPGRAARNWRHRTTWDLSTIPLEQRSELVYWIEVRDNDPGLGLVPLPDGPGKLAASARQRLTVHDDEAEHAGNIRDLMAIRDAAVDLLAARLTTRAFDPTSEDGELRRLGQARQIHQAAATLLTMIAGAVDALALDTMVDEREVETLASIHARLLELHREEAELHDGLPPQSELERPEDVGPLLRSLGEHNPREVGQLEDEIIRLDDLVDGQIIERVEALVARLEASQRKLVEKLEQLAAGDESVRPEIEQLEQRIREDMQRLQEARSQLRKELGEEWMNLDAFKAMEARMRNQALLERLRRGDVEGALEQAREGLDAIAKMRAQVQQQGAESPIALSEEDRKRMKMLRELGRLQDEQTGLRADTRALRQQWRDAVDERQADPEAIERAGKDAAKLREELDEINDARLSREGRRAWEDAREALQRLEAASEDAQAGELELFEAAREAADALERAQAGAESDEAEGKRLAELGKRAERLSDRLGEPLPGPGEVLDEAGRERLDQLGEAQQSLRERANRLLDDPAADILPPEGRQAMRGADRGMQRAHDELGEQSLDDALRGEESAWQGLQKAIDSLRQSSSPPPEGGGGESSTEADRDRSLRDQVVEAMREGDRDEFDEDTKRYYEELLR
ncbi:DUF4175 family protein [Nannocystaceae bacterium ST9]